MTNVEILFWIVREQTDVTNFSLFPRPLLNRKVKEVYQKV